MGEVLSYRLTSIPLSLSHADGSIRKTPKSAILDHLESKIISTEPKRVAVTTVDAIFFLAFTSSFTFDILWLSYISSFKSIRVGWICSSLYI